ncbi:MAG: hypothetical protein GW779_04565 [Candidatus Altiarchaeum hamiconexum]|uniref:Uncharacterized protein n=1 Tax=Candidatus Altarchaeum hamiconexum TaxID=1803513 RepID=A0A8J8CFZ2_9ARCH|nr:hypothetical protein [Candidatus Altarchaeum hamiconexum]OIQ05285.1 MAG: hypothetical protein AUK59_04490 [Candidatus Altarchaeum sp. CG2_30_32_3053]PIN67890.1 MAG: hypothetical protein COV98_01160 [Candidatus Altarchaeum sp. CG12_big_fil_rev_8_21_14_0_65_33_22]PIV28451.1 MAG: hypothetical protein COS36_02085 [Candidatus Altarchaeum sp. CG03_land_8_20_14_0_80_32_618]PIX49200.1 MAG: hypothetical protein COZ53_01360 [Candidatus Altarchaeum sp. CG_4_8_14_3_um_filter_33_2054]PIZ29466.1 MAG: hyp
MKKILLLILLLFVCFSYCLIYTINNACAEGDIVNDLRNLNPAAGLEYAEVDNMKQVVLIMLYTTERKNLSQDMQIFASETKNFLVEFNKIYLGSKKGDLTAKESAIRDCANLRTQIPKNPKYIEEIDAVESANVLLNKFIYDNAMFFENLGNNENITRKKISYYKNASLGYELCEEGILATSLKVLAEETEKKYNKDMTKADGLVKNGLSELNLTNITTGNVENVSMSEKIDAIVKFGSAREKFSDASTIYKSHNEDELANECKEKTDEIDKIMPALQSDAFGFLFLISMAFFLVITYLFLRISEWKKAIYDVSLGDEILGKV